MEEKKIKKTEFSEEFKKNVAEEVAECRISWRDAQIKYGISSQGTIGRWVKKYKHGWVNLPKNHTDIPMKKEDLHNLVLQLKKQLKYSQVQNVVYEKIIDNAEKELKINLRKKPFTKQS